MGVSEGHGICVNRVHLNSDTLIIKFFEKRRQKRTKLSLIAFTNPSKVRGPRAADRTFFTPTPNQMSKSDWHRPSVTPNETTLPLKSRFFLDKNVGVNVGSVHQKAGKRLYYSHLQKSVKESRGAKSLKSVERFQTNRSALPF